MGEFPVRTGDANVANSLLQGRGSRAPITCFPCSSHNLRYNSTPRVAVRVYRCTWRRLWRKLRLRTKERVHREGCAGGSSRTITLKVL